MDVPKVKDARNLDQTEISVKTEGKVLGGSWTSGGAVAGRLLMPCVSWMVEEQRNLQLSCEPTWLMVATFVAICCFDEICSRGR